MTDAIVHVEYFSGEYCDKYKTCKNKNRCLHSLETEETKGIYYEPMLRAEINIDLEICVICPSYEGDENNGADI